MQRAELVRALGEMIGHIEKAPLTPADARGVRKLKQAKAYFEAGLVPQQQSTRQSAPKPQEPAKS